MCRLFPTATNCAPTNHFGSKIIPILPLVTPIKEIDTNKQFWSSGCTRLLGMAERPQNSVKATQNMYCIHKLFKVNGNMEF